MEKLNFKFPTTVLTVLRGWVDGISHHQTYARSLTHTHAQQVSVATPDENVNSRFHTLVESRDAAGPQERQDSFEITERQVRCHGQATWTDIHATENIKF